MSVSSSGPAGSGGRGRHSPSESFSAVGGGSALMGAGSGAGDLSAGIPSGSVFKKTFAVSSLKSLNRRQNYVIVLEFEKALVSFHKVRRGREVKRSFPFHACVKLERGGAAAAGGSVGGSGAAAGPAGANASGSAGVGGGKHSTQLVATFGHEPRYKKSLFFANTDERELFCNLVHAMIVSGNRAVALFKSIQAQAAAQAAAAGANGAAAPVAHHHAPSSSAAKIAAVAAVAAGNAIADESNELVQGMDFVDFLISFSSAQTQLSHSHALNPPAAGGALGAAGSPSFDDDASLGGRARANANDPQAAILAFLAENSGSGADGASGINGLASSNLVSLLNGKLLEGETPINSSDITYRVDCECGGLAGPLMFKRPTSNQASASGVANGAQNGVGSNGQSNGASGSAAASSGVEVSSKDGTGITASSRGLFLLTNYRILYLNYNENSSSYAVREAVHNFERYASWTSPAAAAASVMPVSAADHPSASGGNHALGSPNTCSCDGDIPLGLVSRVHKSSSRGSEGCEIRLVLKDGRRIDFGFDCTQKWVEGLIANIQRMAFTKDQKKLFAFVYAHNAKDLRPAPAAGPNPLAAGTPAFNGWDLYDALAEHTRTTLAIDPTFRIVTSNLEFKLCASYPRLLILPATLRDEEIKSIASYRSQSRLPAVVWVHPITRASLSRCAQPLVGLNRKRSELDEKLVMLLRCINPSNPNVLHILDARPSAAALGNRIMGKGTENIAHYEKTTLQHMNIDNIHAIRNSLTKLMEITSYNDASAVQANSYYASNAVPTATASASAFLSSASNANQTFDETFLSKLESSLWIHYLRLVLAAAQRIAVAMTEEGASCIIHCSDGWDRTSQMAALAEIMLDPYYRTLEGFAILIEKEWLSFGHRFAERYGHASGEYDDEQRAPIFLQFMDCVFQIMHQFPASFEFNEDYLLAIHDHVTTHRFGTFLFNCVQERDKAELSKRTVSLWTFLLHPAIRPKFHNPLYVHPPHVKRWSVRDVAANQANMDALVAQAAAAAQAAEANGGRMSPPAVAPGMPAVPALTSSPNAVILSSFFCIPSVACRRLVLWERMHLRYDREFLRSHGQIQAQIAARLAAAEAAKINAKREANAAAEAAAAAPAAASASSSSSSSAPAAAPAAPANDVDAAWFARYALLKSKILDAGIDLDQLESSGIVIQKPKAAKPAPAAVTAQNAAAHMDVAAGPVSSSPAPAAVVSSPEPSSPSSVSSTTQPLSPIPITATSPASSTGSAKSMPARAPPAAPAASAASPSSSAAAAPVSPVAAEPTRSPSGSASPPAPSHAPPKPPTASAAAAAPVIVVPAPASADARNLSFSAGGPTHVSYGADSSDEEEEDHSAAALPQVKEE